jgi:hypothetical protein
MFVVLLVITLLLGVGALAARSTQFATTTSGSTRQATQAQYLTELGMSLAIAEMSSSRKEAYVRTMASYPDNTCLPSSLVPNGTCYRFGYEDIRKRYAADQGNASADLLNRANVATNVPGSLGYTDLQGNFRVDMTDLGPATPPVAGSDLTSSGAAVTYMAVTLTSTGQVMPGNAQPSALDPNSARATSLATLRSHVVVGPLPKL